MFFLRYNIRNSDIRPIGEESAHAEMMCSCNGPSLGECDGVVKDALNRYFLKNNKQQGGAWHFLTRAGQQDISMIGKTEKSIMEIKSSLPFMK